MSTTIQNARNSATLSRNENPTATVLKIFAGVVIVSMVVATTWASSEKNVIEGFKDVLSNRWAAATLADAYFGFMTFYLWVWYKEPSYLKRALWFAIIMTFGNIGMSAYLLLAIFRAGANPSIKNILTQREELA